MGYSRLFFYFYDLMQNQLINKVLVKIYSFLDLYFIFF